MIIGVTNIKGGVGKTTSSLAIATAAQRSGLSVTVVDTDPQGSATLWAQAAEDADDPLPFPVVSKNQAEIRRMRERRPDRDGELIVIDTPPNGAVVDEAIKTADFVVIPTLSSPIDLQQTMPPPNARTPARTTPCSSSWPARAPTPCARSGPPSRNTGPASSTRRSRCVRTSRPISATHSEATSTDTRTCGTN